MSVNGCYGFVNLKKTSVRMRARESQKYLIPVNIYHQWYLTAII